MRMTRQHAITFSLTLLLAILSGAPAWAQDPGTAGPLAVTVQEYNFGDTAFNPPSAFPGRLKSVRQVHRPTNLAGGPFPLVILLHGASWLVQWQLSLAVGRRGRHFDHPELHGVRPTSPASSPATDISWSPSAPTASTRSDNGVFDLGAQARAELIQHHLDIWNNFNTTGGAPFGTTFVGRVDLDNVGTMGHSRGGEGVMRHVLHNRSLGSPYTVNAVFPLAPVDFNRPIVNGVPFNVLLPYCDGDVSDLQGVHFYDDARYSSPGDLDAEAHGARDGRQSQLLQHGVDASIPRSGRRLGNPRRPRVRCGPAWPPDRGAAARHRSRVHDGILPCLPGR